MNTLTGRAAGISDLKFQISEGQSGAAAPHSKNGVNIFVFVWIRKEASGSDSGRQEATGKGEGGKNRKKRGYNRRAREVAMVMDDAAERKTYDAECD
jgi:hypothetical protein